MRLFRVVQSERVSLCSRSSRGLAVPHVATDRGVRPLPVAVAVEAQMQLHQLRDVLDHVVGVLELGHPLLDHLRAHHFMVMERDAPVLLEASRPRLPDVVEKRGEAQDQIRAVLLQIDGLLQNSQRMLVDILVTVMLVTFQTQCGELRQHLLRQSGVDEQRQALAGVGGEQQLVELLPDPLGGDDLDAPGHLRHRGDHVGSDVEVQLGRETCGAQHPKRIVREGLLGRSGVRRTRSARSSRPP